MPTPRASAPVQTFRDSHPNTTTPKQYHLTLVPTVSKFSTTTFYYHLQCLPRSPPLLLPRRPPPHPLMALISVSDARNAVALLAQCMHRILWAFLTMCFRYGERRHYQCMSIFSGASRSPHLACDAQLASGRTPQQTPSTFRKADRIFTNASFARNSLKSAMVPGMSRFQSSVRRWRVHDAPNPCCMMAAR